MAADEPKVKSSGFDEQESEEYFVSPIEVNRQIQASALVRKDIRDGFKLDTKAIAVKHLQPKLTVRTIMKSLV